jgi:hypothetical protein
VGRKFGRTSIRSASPAAHPCFSIGGMRRVNWPKEIASRLDYLLRQCSPLTFPVDLAKVASRRGVQTIRFRPMPCDGAIEAIGSGFEVHLRAKRDRSVPILAVDTSKLDPRQRFTLAHEIGHTFFYDERFQPVLPQPEKPLLEWICNFAAVRLLLPKSLLEFELGPGGRFDSLEMARDLAEHAGVSSFVVVRRFNDLKALVDQDYALLIVEKKDDATPAVLGACLNGVFTANTKPELHGGLPGWVAKIVPGLDSGTTGAFRVARDDQYDYISRIEPVGAAKNYLFVEMRLEPNGRFGAPRLRR